MFFQFATRAPHTHANKTTTQTISRLIERHRILFVLENIGASLGYTWRLAALRRRPTPPRSAHSPGVTCSPARAPDRPKPGCLETQRTMYVFLKITSTDHDQLLRGIRSTRGRVYMATDDGARRAQHVIGLKLVANTCSVIKSINHACFHVRVEPLKLYLKAPPVTRYMAYSTRLHISTMLVLLYRVANTTTVMRHNTRVWMARVL